MVAAAARCRHLHMAAEASVVVGLPPRRSAEEAEHQPTLAVVAADLCRCRPTAVAVVIPVDSAVVATSLPAAAAVTAAEAATAAVAAVVVVTAAVAEVDTDTTKQMFV